MRPPEMRFRPVRRRNPETVALVWCLTAFVGAFIVWMLALVVFALGN